ncbi:DUF2269 domain-containing protein [Kordiimonas sp. SCSIO 12610]|uniref:DUF2269 family protein n=1 Tax=Kordiimonas sp. SCSIO 12610 TaxID=2829597 RepID=UPI00210A8AD5|nr:DUF2269 domain-containing protein [Kordiimonas sp. SCSIO 12610]UTW56379.1 DUF2269 domain-containing protein [Kordiimonas sp. SCSIO 12610]
MSNTLLFLLTAIAITITIQLMDLYSGIKTLHIISATILFGTGMGTAFFMFRSMFTDNMHEKLYAVRNTVLADYIFTLPAGIIQPMTGFWLIWNLGYSPFEFWLILTYALYIIALICWLPVVWIQIQLKNILIECDRTNSPLPIRYHRMFKIWFWLGWPAFIGLVGIFYLMVTKPS